MNKIFISFGCDHQHFFLGKSIGGNKLAEIPCDSHTQGRDIAFALFGDHFCASYTEEQVKSNKNLKDLPVVKPFDIY